MARWVRFEHGGRTGFGILDGDGIEVHEGDMFGDPASSGERLALDAVDLLPPTVPSKFICLWNNLRAVADKMGLHNPDGPLYVLKVPSALLAPGGTIVRPKGYDGPVMYEGELGIVIGRRCRAAGDAEAAGCIFGYTCVNDATAFGLINNESFPQFPQWTRAKSFDTFGPFGPAVATGLDARDLRVKTTVDGETRQDYPVSDFFFTPAELVARLSHDMTLLPGDLIACGTSLGAQPMEPGSNVEVEIDGVGVLSNRFAG
jgi:2-keto-4-pentenoate hydratase/2-oxohepta-3-ene-1,7-dioic acid hydratase in catechol pathway